MAFCKMTVHVVQPGDTFYRLAQRYQTTVPDIILRNPGINPYNLQVGSRLNICAGQTNEELQPEELELNNDMRRAWLQYLFWMLLSQNGMLYTQPNAAVMQDRLLQTPEDITAVFEHFYPQGTMNRLTQLLRDGITLETDRLTASQNGETQRLEQLDRQISQNAESMARLLADMNTEYSYEELLRQLSRKENMQQRQLDAALDREYAEQVRIFDESENQIMELADYLTEGLLERFYPNTGR